MEHDGIPVYTIESTEINQDNNFLEKPIKIIPWLKELAFPNQRTFGLSTFSLHDRKATKNKDGIEIAQFLISATVLVKIQKAL